jgi:5-methylcytosine-specific restriction endonuclease McrA
VQHSTVWKRDHGICHLCLLPAGPDWHLDHVIPLAQRGPHCYANTAVACASCNHRKHAKAYSADPQIWEAALAAFEEFHLSSRPTEALEAST